ncbi:MAG: hypothetical protein WC401_13210 [Bacteroidales bacterium]
MLVISLNLLGKLSPLGYGNIELCIRDWVLIDINSSVRDRVEANIKDILDKKGMFETPEKPVLFNNMKPS